MTLDEIKRAISNLTLEERAEMARCLHEWEDDDWDRKMKADLQSGRLAKVISKVDADVAQGNLTDLP